MIPTPRPSPANIFSALLVFFAFSSISACSSQGAGQVSKDLSDKMTDSITFKNGTKVIGTPPAEHAASPTYPQVTEISYTGPKTLSPGSSFTLTVKTDFSNKVSITGAAVYVWNTEGVYTSYILVTQSVNTVGNMELLGTFNNNTWLKADTQDFRLEVALGTGTGSSFAVGNYAQTVLHVRGVGGGDETADCSDGTPSEGCSTFQTCFLDDSACWLVADGKRFDCVYTVGCSCSSDIMQQIKKYCAGGH